MKVKPLQGRRVLDLTSVGVGPVCTARLAEYGAVARHDLAAGSGDRMCEPAD